MRRGRWPSRPASGERLGAPVQTIWSDDGIAIRLPEGELGESDRAADGRPAGRDRGPPVPRRRRDRGPGRRPAGELGAVRGALPGERGPGAPPAPAPAGHANATLAAAPALGRPAGRRQPLRQLPDPRRNVSGVPVRRLRPAGAEGRPERVSRAARSSRPSGRDGAGLAVRAARSSSTTSRPTCTRATRRSPSGGPRR